MNCRSEPPGKEQGLSEVPSILRPHTGTYLIIALAFGGLLHSYEHRVHIFANDWIHLVPLLIGWACISFYTAITVDVEVMDREATSYD